MIRWPASPIRRALAPGQVHLWAWPLAPAAMDMAAQVELLDDAERRRMQAFHFPRDRERYALVHANVRRILSGYLDRAAEKIPIRTTEFGKPEVAEGDASTPLHFSLSHSQSTALLAVAIGQPLGVDVEDVRPIEAEVAETHFSARELSDLSELSGEEWLSGFYRCWTRKEAILKAEGVGLHRALSSFDVSLLPGAPVALLGTRTPFLYPWKLHDVSAGLGAVGALATAQNEATLCCFCLLPNSFG